MERGIAWEERKKDEWRRYFRKRAVADEEARRADKIEERIRMMEAMRMENKAVTTMYMEDDDQTPDESEWRKTVSKRRFRAGNRWGSGHSRGAALVTKAGDSMSKARARCLIYNELSNMEWKVMTRIASAWGP